MIRRMLVGVVVAMWWLLLGATAASHAAPSPEADLPGYTYDSVTLVYDPGSQGADTHSAAASRQGLLGPRAGAATAGPGSGSVVGFGVAAKTVPGPNGALRDVATGRFATNPATSASTTASAHGNSRASTALTHLYRLEDADGNLIKWGITSNLKGRYTSEFLSDKTLIPMTSGSRSNMLNLERWIVERDSGPLNFEPWAGSVG